MDATLYFDLASPYAYLAVARAGEVLGTAPRLEPVLLGAIFRHRGHGSWAHTEQRATQVAEVERRAAAYGLPPVAWPVDWPANSLRAMRAAVWADAHGALPAFAHAAFARAFVDGADLADDAVLADAASAAGLPAERLADAVADPAVKDELRARTEAAIAAGVPGVPAVRVGDRIVYGDDRLPEAAALLRR